MNKVHFLYGIRSGLFTELYLKDLRSKMSQNCRVYLTVFQILIKV